MGAKPYHHGNLREVLLLQHSVNFRGRARGLHPARGGAACGRVHNAPLPPFQKTGTI